MELLPPSLESDGNFPTLNQDAILSIMRQLPLVSAVRLCLVNRDFASASKARQMEADILELPYSDRLSDEVFVHLLAQSPALKAVHIGGCDMLSSDVALAALSTVRTLEVLDLSRTSIDAACFALLWCSLPHLHVLDVDDCEFLDSRELDRYLANPHDRCAGRVHTLSLASCSRLSIHTVSLLCRSCGNWLTSLDASGYDELCADDLLPIAVACPSLRTSPAVERSVPLPRPQRVDTLA